MWTVDANDWHPRSKRKPLFYCGFLHLVYSVEAIRIRIRPFTQLEGKLCFKFAMKSSLATFSKLDRPEKFARVKSLIVQIKAMDTPLVPTLILFAVILLSCLPFRVS